MRQLVAPFLILLALGLPGLDPATAAPLPTITVDPGYGPPLTNVRVIGRSFCATCGSVSLSVSALNVDTVPVAADGTFSRIVRIPGSSRPGPVTIAATQSGSTARASFTVTVSQPAPTTYSAPKTVPPPGNLPGGTTSGTPARPSATASTAAPSPGPSTTSPARSDSPAATGTTASGSAHPSGSASPAASASDGPSAVIPVADHQSSQGNSSWLVAALAIAAALAAGGGAWWRYGRRGSA